MKLSNKFWNLLIVFLIFISSNFKTLNFYFWHDDFSTFYSSRLGQCLHGWPYSTYCTIFDLLFKFFGYNPFPYFLLGNLLAVLTVVTFYIFCGLLFKDKKIPLLLSCLMASSYVGSGVFQEAWDPITSFSTMTTLLISLIFCFKAIQNKLHKKWFIYSLVIFAVSIFLFSFRSATNFVPLITLILIFSKEITFAKKVMLSILVFITYLTIFAIAPLYLLKIPIEAKDSIVKYPSILEIFDKVKYFFQTISSFVITDGVQAQIKSVFFQQQSEVVKTLIGLTSTAAFLLFLFHKRNDEVLVKLGIFALSWILFLYLPYSLRTDYRLETTHRYILWIYPGILIAWAIFAKYRWWVIITVIILAQNIFFVNLFYQKHLDSSIKRGAFYSDLHKELPLLPQGATIYFDFAPRIKNAATDYFRVGFTPSESALGVEFGVDYKKIKLITESEILARYIKNGDVESDKLFTFFYDGEKLVNTTQLSRELLSGKYNNYLTKIYKSTQTNFWFDKNTKLWSGNTPAVTFQINDFKVILPSKLILKIAAKPAAFSLPYSQNCINCQQFLNSPKLIKDSLEFLSQSSKIKSQATIETSQSGDQTFADNMLADNQELFWSANRQLWFKGQKPVIDLSFRENVNLGGIILYSNYAKRRPTEFGLVIDDKVIDYQTKEFSKGTKISFSGKSAKNIRIGIKKTDGGDAPTITKIAFIPPGFENLSLDTVEKIQVSPAAYIATEEVRRSLLSYLQSGVGACVKYKNKDYGEGEIPFKLIVDGNQHSYDINLPSLGINSPTFSVSCLNYPSSIELLSVVSLN